MIDYVRLYVIVPSTRIMFTFLLMYWFYFGSLSLLRRSKSLYPFRELMRNMLPNETARQHIRTVGDDRIHHRHSTTYD